MGVGSKTHPPFKGPPKGIISDQQFSETTSNPFQKAGIPTCSPLPFKAALKCKALGSCWRAASEAEAVEPDAQAVSQQLQGSSLACFWITVLFSVTVGILRWAEEQGTSGKLRH